MNPSEAASALAALRDSRDRLAVNTCPPWRHALFAGLFSSVVAAEALPIKLFFGFIAVLFVGLGVTYAVIKARKGVFINGWRAGATRRVSLAIFGIYLTIYGVSWWLKIEHGMWAAPLVGAAILFPMAWYASRRWMQVYRAELGV